MPGREREKSENNVLKHLAQRQIFKNLFCYYCFTNKEWGYCIATD